MIRAAPVSRRLRARGWCGSDRFRRVLVGWGLHPGEPFEWRGDGREVLGAAEHDEDGIVAGDGADGLGPFLPVDGGGDGLGAARERLHHQEVADPVGSQVERGEETEEGGGGLADVGGDGVYGPAV